MKSITDLTPEQIQAKMSDFMTKFAKKTQDNQLVVDVILFAAMKKTLKPEVMKMISLADLDDISTQLRNSLMKKKE